MMHPLWSAPDSEIRRRTLGHRDEPRFPEFCTCGCLTRLCPAAPRRWQRWPAGMTPRLHAPWTELRIVVLARRVESTLFAPAAHIVADLGVPAHVGYAVEQATLVLAAVLKQRFTRCALIGLAHEAMS